MHKNVHDINVLHTEVKQPRHVNNNKHS